MNNAGLAEKLSAGSKYSISASDLKKMAVIVAAGPSLDKTVELIKDKDSYYIIATDTAGLSLINKGIIPDIIISIDGQSVSYNHFIKACKAEEKKPLYAFDFCSNFSAVKHLAEAGAKAPNISKLANDVETSRATVMNYIKYLTDARLLNMIYPVGEDFPKKPAKIMLHNSNLLYAIYPIHVDKQEAMETFFVNSMWKDHKVNIQGRDNHYLVDGRLKFRICDALATGKVRYSPDTIYARYNTEIGRDNQIPLWLLGFLY
jgi:hypothetical protein